MESLKEVRPERTGWRDEALDALLKQHGMEQPDAFLVTEYNYGKSVAIIEYKDIHANPKPDSRLINYCKQRKNKEYYFVILFDYEKKGNLYRITKFLIYAGNTNASEFLKERYAGDSPIILTELQFIKFLYEIRDNTSSEYYQKAVAEYKDWFYMNATFDLSKNVISARHRSYAYDVPAADIDCILCNQSNIPYLFIEYKANHNYDTGNLGGHNRFIFDYVSQETKEITEKGKKKLWNKALIDLGNGCREEIPVIAVEYNLENNIFSLYAFNKAASQKVKLGDMSQEEYFTYISNPENFKKHSETMKKHICPLCKKPLAIIQGRYGKFYGCTGFKSTHCRYTENIKNS